MQDIICWHVVGYALKQRCLLVGWVAKSESRMIVGNVLVRGTVFCLVVDGNDSEKKCLMRPRIL